MYLTKEQVAAVIGQSTETARRLITKLNKELKAKGFIVIPGKISKKYFLERIGEA